MLEGGLSTRGDAGAFFPRREAWARRGADEAAGKGGGARGKRGIVPLARGKVVVNVNEDVSRGRGGKRAGMLVETIPPKVAKAEGGVAAADHRDGPTERDRPPLGWRPGRRRAERAESGIHEREHGTAVGTNPVPCADNREGMPPRPSGGEGESRLQIGRGDRRPARTVAGVR